MVPLSARRNAGARHGRFCFTGEAGNSPVGVGGASQPWIPTGRTTVVADAHRGDGQRFILCTDEELTAFLKREPARGGRAHWKLAISWPDQCLRSHPGKLP